MERISRLGARIAITCAALAALIALAAPTFAQETTGSIRGRIVDAQGLAMPGATVTVTGTQGAKTTVADSEGRFSLPFLTPGVYAVRAELQGFKAVEQKNVTVSLGQAVDLPLKMEVGGLSETVQVTGSSPIINNSSTTTGAVLSSEMFSQVPVGRRVSDTLYMAPGVSTGGSVGSANPSISGGSGLENQYVIDGVNVTNQGYGALGSYSIVFGSLGNATPFDFVKEVQVKTGGYEAEFGQSTGGVVNVVTKSGSNDVRGSVFGYARPSKTRRHLDADDLAQRHDQHRRHARQRRRRRSRRSDLEGSRCSSSARSIRRGTPAPAWCRPRRPAPIRCSRTFPNGADRNRRTLAYSAKGTFQLSHAHRFDASFFGDPSNGENGPQRGSALLETDHRRVQLDRLRRP